MGGDSYFLRKGLMRRLAILFLFLASASVQASDKVAFFGMYLLDSSLQTQASGARAEEERRLRRMEEMVASRFSEEGYQIVDLAPIAKDLDRVVNPAKCYGCDIRMARKLGADYALVGEVQKVSNLILAMNLQLRDAESGDLVKGGVVDIRGNTMSSSSLSLCSFVSAFLQAVERAVLSGRQSSFRQRPGRCLCVLPQQPRQRRR